MNDEAATPQASGTVDELVAWVRDQIETIREIATEQGECFKDWSISFDAVGYEAALAQCEAHTRILDRVVPEVAGLELVVEGEFGRRTETDGPAVDDLLVKVLALAYQHRPGYREEWRP